MSFRTGFVVTVPLDCLLFEYCSYSQFTQGMQICPFPLPTLVNLFYQVWSVPSAPFLWHVLYSFLVVVLGKVQPNRAEQGCQMDKSRSTVWLLRSNGFCEDMLPHYISSAWVPSLGCGWWHVTVRKATTAFWSHSESSAFILNAWVSGINAWRFYRQHPAWNHMLDKAELEDTLRARVSLTRRRKERSSGISKPFCP